MKNFRRFLLGLAITSLLVACKQAPVRFAYLSDTHFSFGAPSVEYLKECIRDINQLDSLDFVLFGGDLTDFGSDAELYAVKEIMDSLKYPYYVVAGNHDAKWSESGCNTFREVFGYEQFEFRKKGWRFLGCSCGPDMRMAPALLPRESMEWLKGLKGGERSIFINHYPQDTSVLNWFDVTRELKRVGVQFEIGGHWHNNYKMNYDGIPAVLGRSSMADKNKPEGYNIFRITDKGEVSIAERRKVDGSFVQQEPWYTTRLEPLKDTVQYDAHGLPDSYPYMRYEVNEEYPQVKEVWRFQEQSNIVAGFAREGDTAYYTTTSGTVNAIRLENGSKIWSQSFPGKIFSTPAVAEGLLVFGCTDHFIYALNAATGEICWKAEAGKSVLGSPVIYKGKVFIGASDGCFRALNLADGAPVWTFDQVEGFIECRPWVDEQQVVFGGWAGKLYSLDTNTGEVQWVWKTPRGNNRMYSPAAVWPVKAAGRVFVAVPDRKVYALDATTGKVLFTVDGGREAIGLSQDGKTVFAKTMYHQSYAFAADVPVPKEGAVPAELWRVENGIGYDISPTAIEEVAGQVITCSDKGNLVALDAATGAPLWYHKLSIALVNPVTAWETQDKIFILASTMDGVCSLLEIAK